MTESKINLIRATNLFTVKSPAVLGFKKKKKKTDERQAHRCLAEVLIPLLAALCINAA